MSELLTREYGLATRTDPTGKAWVAAKAAKDSPLYVAAVIRNGVPTNPGTGIPEYLTGTFTNEFRVLSMIDRYLIELWDKSDRTDRYNKERRAANG